MSKIFKVKIRRVLDTLLMVKADSENEAKAKAVGALFTFSEDDMLFEDDVTFMDENMSNIMFPDCDLYRDDTGYEYAEDYDDEDEYYDEDEAICDDCKAKRNVIPFEPPEYFSD